MSVDVMKLKNGFYTAQKKTRSFLYTDAYILLVLAVVLIAWACQNATFGFVGLILISSVALVFSDDLLPLTVNAFSAMLMIYDGTVEQYLYLWPVFIPLGIAIVVFIVRNFKKEFHLGKMFFAQLAVSFALLIGGVGIVSGENYLASLPSAMALGLGVLAVYLLFVNFTKRDEARDCAEFFAKVLMWIGVVVCIEMLIVIIRTGIPVSKWGSEDCYWNVGWGNRNNIATFILFSAPMALYLSTRKRRGWIYLIIAMFQYVCLILSLSRGGILFGFIGGVVGMAFSIWKAPNRKKQAIYWGIIVAVALICCLAMLDKVKGVIESILYRIKTGNPDSDVTSGRLALYKEAWEQFKEHPFLGVGMGYIGYNRDNATYNQVKQYWFHSTLFQVIACMGIVGILAYGYYYAMRIYLVAKGIKASNKFALFVLVAWIGFEGYSMIDTGTMVPFPNMMLVIVMTYMLELCGTSENHNGVVDGLPERMLGYEYKREECC